MRRGRIFLYLALILILLLVVGYLWWMRQNQAQPSAPSAQPTPAIRTIEIVVAGQNIYPGRPITEDMLATIPIPESQLVAGEFTNKADVVGKYPRIAIAQGVPIMDTMLSSEPGNVNLPGSTWAPYIPNGYTAIAIPITRLTSVGYGIRDGDYVNVIVTMLLVDVDAAYQTILP
ncbi:MAG: Flp pilus assembly protein CpaB, partial [Anaerolineales bacterium]|nr:Flp pilus assembly protein CpaB [Anaerolineales bacterium]